MEQEVNGLDTILGLSGEVMPKIIEVPFITMYTQTLLQSSWNKGYVAIIPYCFKCKEPLVWHTNPDKTLFHCPKCNAKWIKEKDWETHKITAVSTEDKKDE